MPNLHRVRGAFMRLIQEGRPEFADKENFFMVAEFNGDDVELRFVEKLVTTTPATPATAKTK